MSTQRVAPIRLPGSPAPLQRSVRMSRPQPHKRQGWREARLGRQRASAPRSAPAAPLAPHRAPRGPRLARGDDPDAQSGRRARGPKAATGGARARRLARRGGRRGLHAARPTRRGETPVRALPGAAPRPAASVWEAAEQAQGQWRTFKRRPANGRAKPLTTFGHALCVSERGRRKSRTLPARVARVPAAMAAKTPGRCQAGRRGPRQSRRMARVSSTATGTV